eukprot:9150146-Alexandrium_andersonii.AAC.1
MTTPCPATLCAATLGPTRQPPERAGQAQGGNPCYIMRRTAATAPGKTHHLVPGKERGPTAHGQKLP